MYGEWVSENWGSLVSGGHWYVGVTGKWGSLVSGGHW